MTPKTTQWESLSLALVITRREIRDTLRDWRITVPIILLTLIFPILMNITAHFMLDFFTRYRTAVLAERSLPFLLMVVGFFPLSFSLIIALETFVGERERQSLEPLLASPLSNTQLYVGKTLAAMIPPLLASYLGIIIYLGGLFITINYHPPTIIITQIILLTSAEALVMVSGAVIISTQTNSVRAANLLASFVIIPMAFLVQAEAVIMIMGHYDVLWGVLLILIVGNLILVRMGIHTFNRDDLLGRRVDVLNPQNVWRAFVRHLLRPLGPRQELSPGRFYRQDVPLLLWENRQAIMTVLISLFVAFIIGWAFAARLPFPQGVWKIKGIEKDVFGEFEGVGFMPRFTTWGILSHNFRVLIGATLLAVFSFGVVAVTMLMVPVSIIGFLAAQAAISGYNPFTFLAVFILPHGLFEMPAAIVATAMALKLGISIVSPPPDMTLSQAWLRALADFVRVFLLVVLPLLLVAAFVEVNITPKIVLAVYGS